MTKPNYPDKYLEFFQCYHDEEYWEAHEVLEDLWQTERDNKFYHGLIQIAAIMHQLRRGKVRGARKLASSAQVYLSPFQPTRMDVNVSQILDWLDVLLKKLPENIDRIPVEEIDIETCILPRFT